MRSTLLLQPLEVQRPVLRGARPSRSLHLHVDQRQSDQRQQQIVQLVLVANVGPQLRSHAVDCFLVQTTRTVGHCIGQRAAHGNRARAPGRRIFAIEERIGHRVDQLMRKLRRHRRVDGQRSDGTGSDVAQHLQQAVNIHRLR